MTSPDRKLMVEVKWVRRKEFSFFDVLIIPQGKIIGDVYFYENRFQGRITELDGPFFKSKISPIFKERKQAKSWVESQLGVVKK